MVTSKPMQVHEDINASKNILLDVLHDDEPISGKPETPAPPKEENSNAV